VSGLLGGVLLCVTQADFAVAGAGTVLIRAGVRRAVGCLLGSASAQI